MKTIPVLRLSAIDRAALRRHFIALPPADLRLRFEHCICETALLRYVDSIDFDRDAVFGVFDENLELSGVAHLALCADTAEFGVSVLPGRRGEGIGTALFRRSLAYARNHRIDTLFMHCLKENAAMMHIARKSGMEVVLDSAEAEAHLRVPPGDGASFTGELINERAALFDFALKCQFAAARRIAEALGEAARSCLPRATAESASPGRGR